MVQRMVCMSSEPRTKKSTASRHHREHHSLEVAIGSTDKVTKANPSMFYWFRSKTFDRVENEKLIRTLETRGFNSKFFKLIIRKSNMQVGLMKQVGGNRYHLNICEESDRVVLYHPTHFLRYICWRGFQIFEQFPVIECGEIINCNSWAGDTVVIAWNERGQKLLSENAKFQRGEEKQQVWWS